MNTLVKKVFVFSLLGVLYIAFSSGCRKKADTIAIITVKNASSQPLEGAQVVLYGKSTTNQPANVVLYDTTSTDGKGEAIFNFNDVYQLGQAGVAILNIKATSGAAKGEGIIKVVEETTSRETVFIQ